MAAKLVMEDKVVEMKKKDPTPQAGGGGSESTLDGVVIERVANGYVLRLMILLDEGPYEEVQVYPFDKRQELLREIAERL